MKTGADLEVTQETGDTALSLSSFFGRPGAVAELVRRGANVRCRDREGAAPGEVFEAEVDTATRRQIQVNQQHDTGLLGSLVCLPYLVAVWRWFLREQCLEVMWSVFFELFGHQQRLAQDRRKLSPDQQPPPETLASENREPRGGTPKPDSLLSVLPLGRGSTRSAQGVNLAMGVRKHFRTEERCPLLSSVQ